MTMPITIEEQPDRFGVAARAPRIRTSRDDSENIRIGKLGVAVKDLTSDVADQLGYKDNAAGALIARVSPNSPAAEAGLRPNMLVTRVDKEPVKSAAEFEKKMETAALDQGVLLQVQSADGNMAYVVVKAE
jgi:serine protease Do